jgi:hypothetical protein
MKKYAFILLALAGCTTATPMRDSKGNEMILVECNGKANSLSSCYQKAQEVCPGGYKTVEKKDTEEGYVSTWSAGGSQNGFGAGGRGASISKRNIVISCDH